MDENRLLQPELIGRQPEIARLTGSMDLAFGGSGVTLFVSGEAGIGKTRLVSEMLGIAEKRHAAVLRGWCLPECLEPLMPVKEALRRAGMLGLMQERAPPRILSAYILNDAGMLYGQAERTKTGMDADIFAAMLKAVSSFISDSLGMMGKNSCDVGLSKIGHSGYNIVIQTRGRMSLAAVIEGEENEFLIEDMKRELDELKSKLNPDLYDHAETGWLCDRLSRLVNSAKYAGEFVREDPKLKLENMFDSVLLGLQRASAESPVVLFLDDVQWADPTTLGLFHYLSRNTRNSRVFLLATYRPEDIMPRPDGTPHALETIMQDMSRESLFRDIKLYRLGQDGTQGIVSTALGCAEFPRELFVRIHAEAEGNPFFVLEILRLLVDEGSVLRKGDAWVMDKPLSELHLPSKIFDVVQRRLNRLQKQQHEVLECASVVGERFGSDVVGLSMGVNRMQLLKNLNDIEKTHRLIHSGEGGYRFDHSKVRDVIYAGISGELKAEYHRTVAHSYEQLFAGREGEMAGELARHFLEAKDPKAAVYLNIAAEQARKNYANEEAIAFYSLALGIAKDMAETGRISEWLGDLYTVVGDCDRAIASYSRVFENAKEPARKADLQRKMALTFERASKYERGIAAAQAGLDILGDSDDPVRCGLITSMALSLIRMGSYDRALEILCQAMTDATRLKERKEIANAHRLIGITWWFRGDYDRALEHYQNALVIQKDIGDDTGKESTLNNIAVVYMETGRLDEALVYFMEGLEYGEMVGDKSSTASTLDNIGNLLHTKGDTEKALEYQLRGLELYRMSGDRNGIAWSLSSLGYVYQDLDQLEKSIRHHLESVEICREIGDQHIMIYDYYGLADSYRKCRNFEKATEYVDLALALSNELGAKREVGASTYVLATIHRDRGDFMSALETFARARELLADVGDTTLQAMMDYDEGVCLRMSGEAEAGTKLLEKARESFRRMGMGIWLRKSEAALAESKSANGLTGR